MKGQSHPAPQLVTIYPPPPPAQCHHPPFLSGLNVRGMARSYGDPTADRPSQCCPGGSIISPSSRLTRWRPWVRSLTSPGSRSRSGGRTGDIPSEAGQSRLTLTSATFFIFHFTLVMAECQSLAVDTDNQSSKTS